MLKFEIAVLLGRKVCVMNSWFPPKSFPLFILENTVVVISVAVFKMTELNQSLSGETLLKLSYQDDDTMMILYNSNQIFFGPDAGLTPTVVKNRGDSCSVLPDQSIVIPLFLPFL